MGTEGILKRIRAWRPGDGIGSLHALLVSLGVEANVEGVNPAQLVSPADISLPPIPGNTPVGLVWGVDNEGLTLTPAPGGWAFRVVPLKALVKAVKISSKVVSVPIRIPQALLKGVDMWQGLRKLPSRNKAVTELIEEGLKAVRERGLIPGRKP